ncbi:hypothetical protein [Acidicapsa dinghuensis]|nr:hypothetical protein [Acidicapsa dinghuensis]
MKWGQEGEYKWIELAQGSRAHLRVLLKRCPQLFAGKCVVITSYDSGPLTPNEKEIARGWKKCGNLFIVPSVEDVSDLPFEQYDEWYIFPEYTRPEIDTVFVNCGLFSIKSPQALIEEEVAAMGQYVDLVGAKYRANILYEMQLCFWDQLRRVQPESFIASGDRFIFVTCKPQQFEAIKDILGYQTCFVL